MYPFNRIDITRTVRFQRLHCQPASSRSRCSVSASSQSASSSKQQPLLPKEQPLEQCATEVNGAVDAGLKSKDEPRKKRDGYDFFGKPGSSIIQKQQKQQRQPLQPSSTPTLRPTSNEPFGPVTPVFRAAPYRAEIQRQKLQSNSTRILFVDEGNIFRSVLAAAFTRLMLLKLRIPLDVVIETASIGPVAFGNHDSSLVAVAREMNIQLEPVHRRQFDEVSDAVNCDLVVVMDSFDYQEILKEVSVLDTINPRGCYSARIRLLGPFAMSAKRAKPSQIKQDIADSLYGIPDSPAAQQEAVRATAKELAFACRGLVDYLLLLNQKCKYGLTLRMALAQSLQCPLLDSSLVVPSPYRFAADFRPVWQEKNGGRKYSIDNNNTNRGKSSTRSNGTTTGGVDNDTDSVTSATSSIASNNEYGDVYTVRVVNGERRVVKRTDKEKGYWNDIENVERELKKWMLLRGMVTRLPTQQELRKGGASSLASAVDRWGGLAHFSERLGIALAARRPNGYWDNFEHVAEALQPYLQHQDQLQSTSSNSNAASGSMPTQQQLINAGRSDLIKAIRQHGGFQVVAERLGLKPHKTPVLTENEIVETLRTYAAERNTNIMPTKTELEANGLMQVALAIPRLGGFRYFAKAAGLSMKNESSFTTLQQLYENESSSSSEVDTDSDEGIDIKHTLFKFEPPQEPLIEIVGRAVLDWLQAQARTSTIYMPTKQQLFDAGRIDLWMQIQRCGGARRMADHLNLEFVETRGRRSKSSSSNGVGSDGSAATVDGGRTGVVPADAKQEIEIVDAYEEFVIID